MKNEKRPAAVLLAAVALSGCVGMAKDSVRRDAAAHCRKQGKVFTEHETGVSGGMFGHVYVAGQCLGPDDPGYAETRARADVAAKATPR